MSTMQRIREAIEASHQAIEQTDFAKSLIDGRITREAYCQYLSQMWLIHQQLELTLPNCAETSKYFQPEMVRTGAISRDLLALDGKHEFHEPMAATRKILQQMQTWAYEAQYALLGCCYILEGSRMGSLMIGRELIKTFDLGDAANGPAIAGVEYHLQDATQTPRRVKQLKAAIDADNLSVDRESEMTSGACTFMTMLNELYQQLPVRLEQAGVHEAVCPMHQKTQSSKLKSA